MPARIKDEDDAESPKSKSKKTHLFSQSQTEPVGVIKTQEERQRMKMQDALLQSALVNVLSLVSPIGLAATIAYKLYRDADILTDKQRETLDKNYKDKISAPWEKIKSFGFPPKSAQAVEILSAVGSFLKSATQFYTVDMGKFLKDNPGIFLETLKETFKILNPVLNYAYQTLSEVFDKNVGPMKAFANLKEDFQNMQKAFNKMFDFGAKETPEAASPR